MSKTKLAAGGKAQTPAPKVKLIPIVKQVDMTDEMKDAAITVAKAACTQFEQEKDIAGYIKKEFDQKFGLTWHCIVGRQYGSYLTCEEDMFVYFYLGKVAVLLFKSA